MDFSELCFLKTAIHDITERLVLSTDLMNWMSMTYYYVLRIFYEILHETALRIYMYEFKILNNRLTDHEYLQPLNRVYELRTGNCCSHRDAYCKHEDASPQR